MSDEQKLLKKVILQALSGRGSHVVVEAALEGLEWRLAGRRPEGAPHSIFQIVNHLTYWHDFALQWLQGQKPPTPEHAAESWPGAASPATVDEWTEAVARFQDSLAALARHADAAAALSDRGGGKTAFEILQMIASHNSYHIGQVAQLRRQLEAWPPPAGGATW